MSLPLYTFHFVAGLFTLLNGLFLFWNKDDRAVIRTLLLGILGLFGLALIAILYPVDGFARIQLLAWVAFFYFPIFLFLDIFYFHKHNRGVAVGLGLVFILTLLVAIDSFLIEPHWLKVTRIELTSPKLEEPITLAVLADIQTDSPGRYERDVLQLVLEENPDLVLLLGDYIQVEEPNEYQQESNQLNQILKDANLSPRMGIYAVRGNVDRNNWTNIFQGLDVRTIEETETIDLDSIQLTGVNWRDSANPSLRIEGDEKYHIVMGHSPNFSLGEIEGDLLLSGHTHGGQVQIPGIGPLITISVVPRNWASGLTEIEPEKYLLVSRGIGLERGKAPRMRFFCRPEVIFLNLTPLD
jgi:predicted MPP superfamily phosphohydrolase